MVIDDGVIAGLVAHAINSLPTMDEADHDGLVCCPHACAPCASLQSLWVNLQLSDAVRSYIRTSGSDVDWWVGDVETGSVDVNYIFDRWCDQKTCEYHLEYDHAE